jgi:hypothetical protein
MYYPRTPLATQLADALQGKAVFDDAPNGLFLAAPRRTGKSTFLQADLQPTLEARGVVVVYIDLWADPQRDPGGLIAEAIGRALRGRLGLVAKTARAAGLESVSLGGLKIDASKIGQIDGATHTDALRALHQLAQAPVALIVDEAQHALTSAEGENAMTALKSARDQINRPGAVNLMLVMSGSDRDKLMRLVNTASAPFYGSTIKRLPELDTDFIAHMAQLIEAQRPELAPVDRALLYQAFQTFGSRPQFFLDALGLALSPFSDHSGRFENATLALANARQQQDRQQMESDYQGLRPLEQAVLWRLLEQGPRFRPYDADALRFYKDKTGDNVTVAKAQKALEGLRQRQPSLIWKSARSEYAVEDAAMQSWYTERLAAGTWPPADRQLDWLAGDAE